MIQIKTVVWPASQALSFDEEVNWHISEGWRLLKREVLNMSSTPSEPFNYAVFPALYAELEKASPPWPEEATE